MITDLITTVQNGIAGADELIGLSLSYLSELKVRNYGWYVNALMLVYIAVYAAVLGPLFRFCRKFKFNPVQLILSPLFFVNLLLPVILLQLAVVGPSFWLPALVFIALYMLLICVEAQNVPDDGKVGYMLHSQLVVFIIIPGAVVLRLLVELYRFIVWLL